MLALVLWSTSFPIFTKILNPAIGGLFAGALAFTFAGLLGILIHTWRRGGMAWITQLPKTYLLICGPIFLVFAIAMFLAINLASHNSQQSIEITLINYLWIPLIFVFSIPILGQRAKPTLALGILIATAGVFLASTNELRGQAGTFNLRQLSAFFQGLWNHLLERPWPYPLALLNAICWAAYSVASRRLLKPEQHDALPLFMFTSGLLLLPMAYLLPHEPAKWSLTVIVALAFAGLLPGLTAYSLWDLAIRRGDLTLLTAASYGTPLLATLFNCLLHRTPLSLVLLLACALVIGGAIICNLSVQREPAIVPAQTPNPAPMQP